MVVRLLIINAFFWLFFSV